MTAPVLLSVIIPTYQRSGFVRDCLRSLRACGAGGLEVIVVDDGGTDDTAEVVARTEPRAAYVHQANQGPAAARNHGLRLSRGRYVSFLDCDDAWLPGVAPRALESLQRHPRIDLLFADARMGNPCEGFASWIESAGEGAFRRLPGEELEPGLKLLEREAFFHRMAERNAVFLGACILKRECVEAVGGFDAELCGAADWHLWLRLACRVQCAFLDEPLAIYTKHAAGMSNDHDGMSREFCATLGKLRGDPHLTAGQRAWVAARHHHHLFGYAYRAYDRGEFAEARRRFAALRRAGGGTLKARAYECISALPFGAAGALRWCKHRLAGEVRAPREAGGVVSSAVRGGGS